MTPAEELLNVLTKTSEGTRKTGFTVGGATLTLNQTNDTITAQVTIPVKVTTNADGAMVIEAEDFLTYGALPVS